MKDAYRDETETLREELRQTSAELARVSAELMKRDAEPQAAIEWRTDGGMANWAIGLICLLLSTAVGTCAASHDVYNEGHPRASLLFAVVCVACVVATAAVWYRAVPRVEVER